MPRISYFYGISIYMHYNDHGPPHFHAHYGEDEVVVAIQTVDVLSGRLSRRATRMILEWAEVHKAGLLENWDLRTREQPLKTIEPLE
jgi:hypothetical protein